MVRLVSTQRPNGRSGTSIGEDVNCSLRQRCGVLVRTSCSFSKKRSRHTAQFKIAINNHTATST